MAQTIKDLVMQIGDPNEVAADMSKFRRAAKALSAHQPRMPDKYPKQWIALYDGKVVARGRTYRSVLQQADEQNVPRSELLVRFIDKNRRTMVL